MNKGGHEDVELRYYTFHIYTKNSKMWVLVVLIYLTEKSTYISDIPIGFLTVALFYVYDPHTYMITLFSTDTVQ